MGALACGGGGEYFSQPLPLLKMQHTALSVLNKIT
jgi:hypothetical protein